METVGAIRIFRRSTATRGLKYKNMLGDGDSATYNAVIDSKPYGNDCIPNKLECIGHVQKRVGSRLRRLKNKNKRVKLADGKGLAGKGRLTDGKVDVLQNYYELAVRENLHDVDHMAKAIKASLYHVASTDANPQHHRYLSGNESWCGYKRDKTTYKHKNGIPKCIVNCIEPVFQNLNKPELLCKCTHGLTQNVNECPNGLIWDRCPKSTYVEQECVALATVIKIFNELNITPGLFTWKGSKDSDISRMALSTKKSSESVKKRRKTLRHIRKSYIDTAKENEGKTYEADGF